MSKTGPQGTRTPREGRFLLIALLASIGSIAFVAAWLAPNHYLPWTSFHGELAAFAALCLFCMARALMPQPAAVDRVLLCTALLVALIWVQWIFGQIAYRGDALVSSIYVVGFALAWWLGSSSANVGARISPFLWFACLLLAGAVISVYITMLQWLRMETAWGVLAAERGPQMRPFGNLGQPNQLSSLLLMAIICALALHVAGVIKRWHLIAIVVWLSLGLTMAESRSALLGALAIGMLLLAEGRSEPQLPERRMVAGWWAMLLSFGLLWTPLNESLYLQPAREARMTHDNAREVMWKQCLSAIEQSPWTGYGWRQTIVAQKTGAEDVPGWLATDYAHNIVLDLLLWVGLPLGLLLVGAIAWWLIRAAMRLRGPTQVLLYAMVLPLLVHSMFEFPFAYSYFLLPAAWILGLLARLQNPAGVIKEGSGIRHAALAVTLALSVVGVAIAAEYLEAEEDYRVMRFELRRVGKVPAGYRAPELPLLTQIDELLKLGRLTPTAGMPAVDIERLRAASASFGWATLHLSYAVALGLNGNPGEASHQLGLLRNVYGMKTYTAAKERFGELKREHPELAAVVVP